ncbi:hypothetical protein [Aurantimonas coralicida]|uniref:hypothetical protein n=1 Tax=Aurantimonas coralicida TaxID=182270 RepID=UPI0004293E1F|nr:hypothetical protein [Aurantimonas coralicida]
MPFIDCINSAIDQGTISRDEGEALSRDFETKFAQKRAQLGDDQAAKAAQDELAAELRAQAIEKRRRAVLTEKARQRLKGRILDYRDENGNADVYEAAVQTLSHYGYAGASSVRGRQEAILSMTHGKLTDLMTAVSRDLVTGRRTASAGLIKDVVRELHGQASGDATAKGLAGSLSSVFEDLRQRFNNAGGAIAKLDEFGLPHSHNGLSIRQAGRDQWKAFIRPLVDPDKMRHPLTGQPVGAHGIDQALDHVYETITTNGWAHHTPKMSGGRGKGALASQRQDHRFIAFKSADDWLTYNGKFGDGDPVQAIFRHVNGMARDIAMLEEFGPNPTAMLDWMIQGVRSEIAKGDVGKASLAKIADDASRWARGTEPGVFAEWRLNALFAELRGRPTAASGVATATASVKNVMNSALLGAAGVVAATTDPFMAQAARRLAGLPITKDFGGILKMMSTAKREEIVRAGVIWDDYLHTIEAEARFVGPMLGHNWSQYLVDRSMMVFGLKPLTTGRKLVEARAWQSTLADEAGKDFATLPARLRETMEGFGINADDWEIMRASVDAAGFVTPTEIARRGGEVRYIDTSQAVVDPAAQAELRAIRHREVAEKLAELTSSWSERSVPSGTPNARSFVTGNLPRGTPAGEAIDFALQFKSFGLSFTTLQVEALQQILASQSGGRGSAANYAGALVLTATLGGAMAMQIKSLADGKDLEDMSAPSFWFKAMVTGGGFGLFGDFVNGSSNRFGQGFAGTLIGPAVAFLDDAAQLTVGNAIQFATGEDTKLGREAVNFAGRYTPVASSWWATRGAYRRLMLDQLQWLVDPDADKSFKAKASQLKSRTGQEYWWPPGQAEPSRAPAMTDR